MKTITVYPSELPPPLDFVPIGKIEKVILKAQIEPYAFEILQNKFPNFSKYQVRLIQKNLSDCVLRFHQTVGNKIAIGTEIMLDFADSHLIFKVINYSQNFNQIRFEEIYDLNLSKIEKMTKTEHFLSTIEKNKEFYY